MDPRHPPHPHPCPRAPARLEVETILTFHGVTFAYPNRPPTITNETLTLQPGQATRLEAPSGAGKTTLLRLATGAIPRIQGGRIQGTVTLDDDPVHTLPPRRLAQRIGYVPQDPETAFIAPTVHREIETLLKNTNTPTDEIPHRIQNALAAFDAHHLQHRDIPTLSGGETQRVALAAATATEPPLLILDEPHAQLDQQGRKDLESTLRGLKAGGRTLLLATHTPHPFDDVIDHTHTLPHDETPPTPTPIPPAPPQSDPLLELNDLHHAYDDEHTIGPIDLALHPGEILALTGPNGSGKTTALHAAAGILEPTHGHASLLGDDPTTLNATQRAQRVGIAFQHPAWHITQDTLHQEIALTPNQLGQPTNPTPWLARLGLEMHAGTHPWDLSGGERQRMALLTAVTHQPPIVLLDEPTRGLDDTNRARIQALLAERARQGKATLIASHHEWIADIAHRTVQLGQGATTPDKAETQEVVYA